MYIDRIRRLSFLMVRCALQKCAHSGPISEHHRKTGTALMPRSVGVTCLLALTALCSAAFAKTALAQDFTGAVYVGTNAQQNGLVAYGRKADGTLAYIGVYLSGGAGGRLNTGGRIDPLISAHSVLNVDNRFVLQVNAGSNTVSSFRINEDFSLTLVNEVPSGGFGPDTIAERDGVLYVAMKRLNEATQNGSVTGQYALGLLYASGAGVEKNSQEAVRLFRLAAEQGAKQAQSVLGQIYEFGQGVPVDRREAAGWYRKAAEQADADSAARLGRLLLLGQGVDQNLNEAVRFLTLAADRGNAYAQFNLAGLYVAGTGVKRDLRKAYSLFTLAGKTLDVSKQLNEISSQLERESASSVLSTLHE